MKKTIILYTLLLASAVALAQTNSTNMPQPWFLEHTIYPFKGQVKEVREYRIEMRNDEELQDTDYYFYSYSPEGHLVAEHFDDVDKLCDNRYYWSGGRLDSIVCDGECLSYTYYLYDSTGRLTNLLSDVTSYDLDTITIIYDQRGFPVAVDDEHNKPWFEWYDDGRLKGMGTAYWQKWYEYDSQGRIIKETFGDTYVTTYTYNEQGDLVQIEESCIKVPYCGGGGWTRTTTYKFDAHGNWMEEYVGTALKAIRKIIYYEQED